MESKPTACKCPPLLRCRVPRLAHQPSCVKEHRNIGLANGLMPLRHRPPGSACARPAPSTAFDAAARRASSHTVGRAAPQVFRLNELMKAAKEDGRAARAIKKLHPGARKAGLDRLLRH